MQVTSEIPRFGVYGSTFGGWSVTDEEGGVVPGCDGFDFQEDAQTQADRLNAADREGIVALAEALAEAVALDARDEA